MRKANINNSTFFIEVKWDQTSKMLEMLTSYCGVPETKKKKESREHFIKYYPRLFSPAEYEKNFKNLELLPPMAIREALLSDELVPDGFHQESDATAATPIYQYDSLLNYALEKGLVVEQQRERIEEVIHHHTITETYYEVATAPLALPYYQQGSGDE